MPRCFLSLIVLLLPLGSAAQLIAAPDHVGPQPCKELAKNRKSVGLVLEGGVALGLAHVGVLRWLEQNRIPVDCIAGTSMGGLIGVLYSMGYSPRAPGTEQKKCAAKDQKDCPRNMETFLKGLLDQDRWESVFYDLIDYRNLSFSRKVDRRSYPNSFRFRLNRSIHLPEGIVPGHRVGLVFDDLAWPYSRVQSFNDLPVPFRCVATDLKRRQSDVLGTDVFSADVGAQGRLTEALRATMSLPVYFSPVDLEVATATGKVEQKSYVDGGVLKNLPVSALKDMGADVIIAVHLNLRGQSGQCLDTGTPATAAAGTSERSLFDALTDTLSVVTSANEQRSIRELAALPQQNGLCVNVDVSGFEPTDFDQWSQLISRGFQAPEETHGFTDRVLTGESKLSLDEKEYQDYQDAVKARLEKQFQSTAHPSYVTIETAPTAYPNANENPDPDIAEWVRRTLSCSVMQKDHHYDCPRYVPGQFAEKQAQALEKQLTRMVGTGRFSRLGYHMLTTDDSGGAPPATHVAITAENSDYTGAEVQPIISVDGSDYESPVFALGARFTAFDYGFAGSEWRGEAVLGSRYGVNTQYQIPVLGPASHWFIAPGAIAESFPYNVYHDQDELARYQLRTISGSLDMGYNFGSAAQVRVGYEGGGAKLSQKLGAMIFPFTSGRTGTTSLKFSLDLLRFSLEKLEAPVVPRNGIAVNSIFQWHDAWLGASDHFASAAARLEAFKSVSRSGSFYLKADGGSSLGYVNNGLPLFSFGTPLRLAAYGSNELRTNQYAYGGIGYVHRIYQFKALGGAIYATGSFEMAKVYGVPGAPNLPRDGVAGVILNSIVGPLYLAGTLGNAGHKKFFFYMGKIF